MTNKLPKERVLYSKPAKVQVYSSSGWHLIEADNVFELDRFDNSVTLYMPEPSGNIRVSGKDLICVEHFKGLKG